MELQKLVTYKYQAEKPPTAKCPRKKSTLAAAAATQSPVPPASTVYINLRRKYISFNKKYILADFVVKVIELTTVK